MPSPPTNSFLCTPGGNPTSRDNGLLTYDTRPINGYGLTVQISPWHRIPESVTRMRFLYVWVAGALVCIGAYTNEYQAAVAVCVGGFLSTSAMYGISESSAIHLVAEDWVTRNGRIPRGRSAQAAFLERLRPRL